jgi:hypothetical protein
MSNRFGCQRIMNLSTVTGFVAGSLQFVVAAYALRLNRLFGTARVGWSLFCAFFLLSLLHLSQVITPAQATLSFETEVEVIYALVSMLLLTGMIHLETLLKERNRLQQKEQEIRAELENEVKKKTAYLTRAIEGLQAEIDERKRVESMMQSTDFALRAASNQLELAGMASSALQSAGPLLRSTASVIARVAANLEQAEELTPAERKNLLKELSAAQSYLAELDVVQHNYARLAETNPVPGIAGSWDRIMSHTPEGQLSV